MVIESFVRLGDGVLLGDVVLTSLDVLNKDEIGKVEFNDEIREGFKKLIKANVISNGIPLVIITLIISYLIRITILQGNGAIIALLPMLFVYLLILFKILSPIIRLRENNIKYATYCKLAVRVRSKSNKGGLFSGYTLVCAVEENSSKRLPIVRLVNLLRFKVRFGETYLFVSYDGKVFYLVPVTGRSSDEYDVTDYDVVDSDVRESYTKAYTGNYDIDTPIEGGLVEDDLSDLGDSSYSSFNNNGSSQSSTPSNSNYIFAKESDFENIPNDELLNNDLQMYKLFKKLKSKGNAKDSLVVFAVFISFAVIIGFLAFGAVASGQLDTGLIITLVGFSLFILAIVSLFAIQQIKIIKKDRYYNKHGHRMKYASVLKYNRVIRNKSVGISLDLVTSDGYKFASVRCLMLNIYDKVEVGDEFIIIQLHDGLCCIPTQESYNNIIGRK